LRRGRFVAGEEGEGGGGEGLEGRLDFGGVVVGGGAAAAVAAWGRGRRWLPFYFFIVVCY